MSHFRQQLAEHQPSDDDAARRWIFVPYDQLTDAIGPLSRLEPSEVGIVMVETDWKAARRPYHRQKLAYVLANMRHFALEQASRGVSVRYVHDDRRYGVVLREFAEELGGLTVMRPAERELRVDIAELVNDGLLEVVDHEGWLTSYEQFRASQSEGAWRMDAFYRHIRRETGVMMEEGSPVGGQYSFDGDNREFWPGEPPAAVPPTFEPDAVTREVGELIAERFDAHPGEVDLAHLPATRDDAERFWGWALQNCMELFGPYEDAMSRKSRTIFHTRVSSLMNLHRLLPERVVDDVLELDIPRNSKEGFVRQVLGWREFMNHVHRATDGFRAMPEGAPVAEPPVADRPGDGGFAGWAGREWEPPEEAAEQDDGGAAPNFLEGEMPVPPAFWGERSGLECFDEVVEGVWEEGYSHHITRLMVLANIATLLDVEPRALTDWFWVAYTDAYDWVVEPNVLGMGTFGLGEFFTTKPYVSGSNYIDKMSDYCDECAFDPGKDCPLKSMYWAFLERHEEELSSNNRMGLMYGNLRRRSDDRKTEDAAVYETVREILGRGGAVEPEDVE
jgi:deoxyribodipyrimidine photolyase-related protein